MVPVDGMNAPLFALEVSLNLLTCLSNFFIEFLEVCPCFLGLLLYSLYSLTLQGLGVFRLIFFVLQINPEKSKEEFRSASQNGGGTGVKDFMDSMGLGMLADQVHILSNTIYSGILSNIL